MSESSVPVPRPSEPLPCPFCGRTPIVKTVNIGDVSVVKAVHPWVVTECFMGATSVEIGRWNRRSPSVPTATQEQRDADSDTDKRDAERYRALRPWLEVDSDADDADHPTYWWTRLNLKDNHPFLTRQFHDGVDGVIDAARVQGENSQ